MRPEEAARLRHQLLTPLYQAIGYADRVRQQAREQGAATEATLMEEAAGAARRIQEMLKWALPVNSHVAAGAVPRLAGAMLPETGLILSAAARFEELTGRACAVEISKIRESARELRRFARSLAGSDTGEPASVLVVDDEDIVCRTARAMLEHRGYRALLAGGGEE